ncbi:transketolase family protein [Candidatus Woesearchaeota archaeon]|nr:transketolase family protein [Candidatus Woesearchaeota archaeon]
MIATRDAYGKALVEQAKKNKDIVSLSADLGKSTKSVYLEKEFPEREIKMGISEQDMMVTAAGLAHEGKIAFPSTFAIFTERGFEQIRNSIARPNMNVKIVGSHAGLITGEDGSSAQCIEDFAIYRALPNMTVLCPVDAVETTQFVEQLVKHKGPSYMRTTRNKVPVLYDKNKKLKIGKGEILKEGNDVVVIGCGPLVSEALRAAEELEGKVSVMVINISTIKPIDKDLIIKAAKQTDGVVTAEDHNVIGGLGSAVADVLSENYPAPLEKVGVNDVFGESGKPTDLYEKYGLTSKHIKEAIKRILKR